MRILGLGVTIALLSACSGDQVSFDLRTTMDARTNGVVLSDDGAMGDAAMFDQICAFDAMQGEVIGDLDLGESDERVLDAFGPHVLAAADGALHLVDRNDISNIEATYAIDAIEAKVLHNGIVSLVQSQAECRVIFDINGLSTEVNVPGMTCDNGCDLAVDREREIAFVANGESLAAVTLDGVTFFENGAMASMVAYDPIGDVVMVSNTGYNDIRGMDIDGNVLWDVEASGNVFDSGVSGEIGATAFMIEHENGGEVVVLDSVTGEQRLGQLTPDVADISVSLDGGTIALSTPDSVFIYDVQVGVSEVQMPSVDANPRPPRQQFAD